MKIFSVSLATTLLLITLIVVASGQESSETQRVGARVDAIFASYARADAPGCAVSIAKRGKILYANGYGLADVSHNIRFSPQTAANVASTSKPFTALAVLLLESEGKLKLEDDVRRYVPEVPDFGSIITLRMLLNHTSGLRELSNLFYFSGWRNTDEQYKSDALEMLQRQRALNHLPGAEFSYNSTGYTILAIVVERVSGISYRRFIIDRIFTPLGMTQSDVEEDIDQVVSNRAIGYWGHDPLRLRTARPSNSFPGPNGIVTSVEDLAHWDANFYEYKVGSQSILDKMSTRSRLANGTEFGYGLGFYIGTHRGYRMVSHAGSDYGYKSEFIRFPEEQLSVSVLCNAFDIAPTPLALQVADLFLPHKEETRVATPVTPRRGAASENAALFAGLYWNDETAQTGRFIYKDGKLYLDGGGEGLFELTPLGNNSFRLAAAPRRFVLTFFTRDGSLIVRQEVEGSATRESRKVVEKKPALAELRLLEGKYYSSELDVTWTFVLRDGALVLERHRWKPSPLEPVFGDVFQTEGFVLTFKRTQSRQMSLELTTERVRHLLFTRVSDGKKR